MKIFAGIFIGAMLGMLMGYFGKCASGACPLTSTPLRGAIYGAFLGFLFSFIK
ncbi:MAG: hypothetical protein KAI43_13910 [Candidatus Aureabacteria bacterium]|nr:hypothetical protein [Candidatus Auribacterota bacterium]